MTVGQFKKFISMFTLADTKIAYMSVEDGILYEELDEEDIFDEYKVYSFTMYLADNVVHVGVLV